MCQPADIPADTRHLQLCAAGGPFLLPLASSRACRYFTCTRVATVPDSVGQLLREVRMHASWGLAAQEGVAACKHVAYASISLVEITHIGSAVVSFYRMMYTCAE